MTISGSFAQKATPSSGDSVYAVDLFCGVGGLTYGLRRAGINVVAGIDIDTDCEYPYTRNNPGAKFIKADVGEITVEDLRALYPSNGLRLLAGCAPCQPFSNLNQGHRPDKRKEWPLLTKFGRLVAELKPDFVSMENVPQVKKHKPFQDFLDALKAVGYSFDWKVVRCSDYGVPQERMRLVLLGSLGGAIAIPAPTHGGRRRRTVRDAIQGLPRIAHGESHPKDRLHVAAGLREINVRRIQASKPGGTWRDWPDELRLACHRREGGSSFTPVYGRMRWDAPAPTITTEAYNLGSGRFGHPEQDRAISLREAATIQTFPKSYRLVRPGAPVNIDRVCHLIGNAVPPRLGHVLGNAIIWSAR